MRQDDAYVIGSDCYSDPKYPTKYSNHHMYQAKELDKSNYKIFG